MSASITAVAPLAKRFGSPAGLTPAADASTLATLILSRRLRRRQGLRHETRRAMP
jgi:hypothetical protein